MLRRHLLLSVSLIPLAACGTPAAPIPPVPPPGPPPVPNSTADDISLVAAGLRALLSFLPGTATARYQGYVTEIEDFARTIATASSADAVKAIVQQVLSIAGNALNEAQNYGLPAAAQPYIMAARVLLPILASAVGIFMAAPRTRQAMTPAEARAILRQHVR